MTKSNELSPEDSDLVAQWLKNNTPTQCEPMATSETIEYTRSWGGRKKAKGETK